MAVVAASGSDPARRGLREAWGILAIFIGRFFGPLRASVPPVAGIFEMPYWQFQIANFNSALVWAAVLLTLDGISFGLQWLRELW